MSDSTQTATRRGATAPPPDEDPQNLPATTPNGALTEFDDDAPTGFEGTRIEEQTVPFLRMAQGMSDELKPSKGSYISGLVLGMIFNTSTREMYPGQPGVEFIACKKEIGYGRWIPRDINGGGFRGMVSLDDPVGMETLQRMNDKYGSSGAFNFPSYKDGRWSDTPPRHPDTGEEIEIVRTGQIYILYSPAPLVIGTARRAVVSFTKTALPKYQNYVDTHLNKKWPRKNGTVKEAPINAYKWRLSAFLDKRGVNEFYNWRVDLLIPNDYMNSLYAAANPELYAMALEFTSQLNAGTVKADDTGGQVDGTSPGQVVVDEDQVPF